MDMDNSMGIVGKERSIRELNGNGKQHNKKFKKYNF